MIAAKNSHTEKSLKRAARREIENRKFTIHPIIWGIPTQTKIGTDCIVQLQLLLKECLAKVEFDLETRTALYAANKKDHKTIARKKRQYQDLISRFETESIGLPEDQIGQLRAIFRPKFSQLSNEIVFLEEKLDNREEKIEVIEQRLFRILNDFNVSKNQIQSMYDSLLSIFHGEARAVYNRIKLPSEPLYPETIPTVAIMKEENIISFNHTNDNADFLSLLNKESMSILSLTASSTESSKLLHFSEPIFDDDETTHP